MQCWEETFDCQSNREEGIIPFCIYKEWVSCHSYLNLQFSFLSCAKSDLTTLLPVAVQHMARHMCDQANTAEWQLGGKARLKIELNSCMSYDGSNLYFKVCDNEEDCEGGEDEKQPQCEREITEQPVPPDATTVPCTEDEYQ